MTDYSAMMPGLMQKLFNGLVRFAILAIALLASWLPALGSCTAINYYIYTAGPITTSILTLFFLLLWCKAAQVWQHNKLPIAGMWLLAGTCSAMAGHVALDRDMLQHDKHRLESIWCELGDGKYGPTDKLASTNLAIGRAVYAATDAEGHTLYTRNGDLVWKYSHPYYELILTRAHQGKPLIAVNDDVGYRQWAEHLAQFEPGAWNLMNNIIGIDGTAINDTMAHAMLMRHEEHK